jgi:transposase-like protein
MLTLENVPGQGQRPAAEPPRYGWPAGVWLLLLMWGVLSLALTGCKKEAALDAMESDANGYVCLKCGAKYYTGRTVFIGPKCPKCKEDLLVDVVGYYCEKDHQLTIRPRRGDRVGPVCEVCQAPLVNAMRSPRQKDLIAWGAAEAPAQ